MVRVSLSGGEARVYKGSAFPRAACPAHRSATPACATRMRGCAGRPAQRMRSIVVQLLSCFVLKKTVLVTAVTVKTLGMYCL